MTILRVTCFDNDVKPAIAKTSQRIIIDAVGDSAYRHKCGAMVSPRFSAGGVTRCPLCKEAV